MSGFEGAPKSIDYSEQLTHLSEVQRAEVQEALDTYGLEYFQDEFGLGIEEISQVTKFGEYDGPFVTALVPSKNPAPGSKPCPVPGVLREGKAQGGIEGVQRKLEALSLFEPSFKITISEKTLAREEQKKN